MTGGATISPKRDAGVGYLLALSLNDVSKRFLCVNTDLHIDEGIAVS